MTLPSDPGIIGIHQLQGRRLKSYNGFSGEQRGRAQSWLNAQWRSGAITRPLECVACGQTAQPIDAHAEDYSEPFRKGLTDGVSFVLHLSHDGALSASERGGVAGLPANG